MFELDSTVFKYMWIQLKSYMNHKGFTYENYAIFKFMPNKYKTPLKIL